MKMKRTKTKEDDTADEPPVVREPDEDQTRVRTH